MSESQDLIGTRETAEIMRLDRSTVLYRVRHGLIPFEAKLDSSKGAYLFRRADIEALAAERASVR